MNVLLTLGIDTSGKIAAVALLENDIFLSRRALYTKLTHSQIIMKMIKDTLSECQKTFSDIDIYAVSCGPGSYTGLRIGVSAVKAICFATNKPCIGVSTLEAMACDLCADDCKIISIMKARQSLVYSGAFEAKNGILSQIGEDEIIEKEALISRIRLLNGKIILTGDGALELSDELSDCTLAPPRFRMQSAEGVCLAAQNHKQTTPNLLEARYYEITKAEKELEQKNHTQPAK